jgi:hypothetical protein
VLLVQISKSTVKICNSDIEIVDLCWKDFLLNQFHDVLPGSCIEAIVEDAWALYANVFTNMMGLRTEYNTLLVGTGTTKVGYNPLSWDLRTVIFNNPDAGTGLPVGANVQAVTLETTAFEEQVEGRYRVPNKFTAALVDLKASGFTALAPFPPPVPVSYTSKFQI